MSRCGFGGPIVGATQPVTLAASTVGVALFGRAGPRGIDQRCSASTSGLPDALLEEIRDHVGIVVADHPYAGQSGPQPPAIHMVQGKFSHAGTIRVGAVDDRLNEIRTQR